MPTYSVAQARSQSLGLQGQEQKTKMDFSVDFKVSVTLGTGETIADIDAYSVATASGIPVINETTYEYGGIFMPYVVCRKVSASPQDGSFLLWKVTATYETFENSGQPFSITSIPNVAALTPVVTTELGETEDVLYEDFTLGPVGPIQCALTPAKNFWSEPVVTRTPTLVLKISQYETSITYDTMLARKFKTNDATYRSQAAGKWLITEVEASEVKVKIAGSLTALALVTYTVALSNYEHGWNESRALLDTQYIDVGGEIKLFQNDTPGATAIGYITAAGARRVSQSGIPDSIEYKIFEEQSFSFLQV